MTAFNRMLRLAMPAICTLGLGAAAMAQTTTGTMMGTQKTTTSTPMQPTGGMSTGTTKSKGSGTRIPASETFKTTTDASAHCPGGTVVWSTLSKTKTYHLAKSKYYGKTKHGAFVCQQDADAAGFRALKN